MNFAAISTLVIIARQSQMLITLAQELAEIPIIGWAAAAVVVGLEADMIVTSGVNFYNSKKDKNTPIYKYTEAKLGGWDAHLVPL